MCEIPDENVLRNGYKIRIINAYERKKPKRIFTKSVGWIFLGQLLTVLRDVIISIVDRKTLHNKSRLYDLPRKKQKSLSMIIIRLSS